LKGCQACHPRKVFAESSIFLFTVFQRPLMLSCLGLSKTVINKKPKGKMQGTIFLLTVPFMSSHCIMKFRLFATININTGMAKPKGNGIKNDRGTREWLYAVVFWF
jgi:hypothetical protein